MPPEFYELSEGRMAHYVDPNGVHLAATVCWVERTSSGEPTGELNVQVYEPFRDGTTLHTQVPYDNVVKRPGTWHFMERLQRPASA